MPRLIVEGDAAAIEALRLLLTRHSTLSVRILHDHETGQHEAAGALDLSVDVPAELPAWAVLPLAPRAAPPPTLPLRNEHLSLATDGSSRGNPGPCGMAVVVADQQNPSKVVVGHGWGDAGPCTNNQAELAAVISALNYALIRRAAAVKIETDSEYVSANLPKFEARMANGTFDVRRNTDLWRALLAAKAALQAAGADVKVTWVKGHANHLNNKRADRIAVKSRKELRYRRTEFSQNEAI